MRVPRLRLMLLAIREELHESNNYFHSLRFLFRIVLRKLIGPGDWRPSTLVEQPARNADLSRVAFVLHIFHPEYVERVQKLASSYPDSSFYVTTPSSEIAARIEGLLEKHEVTHRIKVVPNIGRNFGPLFVEFSKELESFTYFIHLHSKRSVFLKSAKAIEWADRCWRLLAEEKELLLRSLNLMRLDSSISIAYPDVSDLVAPINFRFGMNRPAAERLLEKAGLPADLLVSNAFGFPVGGMFLARTSALRELLEAKLVYDDFPEELGQRDGTTQHAIERLVGILASTNGGQHLVYLDGSDCFTTETTYVGRR